MNGKMFEFDGLPKNILAIHYRGDLHTFEQVVEMLKPMEQEGWQWMSRTEDNSPMGTSTITIWKDK